MKNNKPVSPVNPSASFDEARANRESDDYEAFQRWLKRKRKTRAEALPGTLKAPVILRPAQARAAREFFAITSGEGRTTLVLLLRQFERDGNG